TAYLPRMPADSGAASLLRRCGWNPTSGKPDRRSSFLEPGNPIAVLLHLHLYPFQTDDNLIQPLAQIQVRIIQPLAQIRIRNPSRGHRASDGHQDRDHERQGVLPEDW